MVAWRWMRRGVGRRRSLGTSGAHRSSFTCTVVGLLGAGAVTTWIGASLQRPVTVAWLIAINSVVVVVYGWDKLAAALAVSRIPETTLHLLALAGGSVGALVAQGTFHHKTEKVGFQLKFWSVVAVQVALIAVYMRNR